MAVKWLNVLLIIKRHDLDTDRLNLTTSLKKQQNLGWYNVVHTNIFTRVSCRFVSESSLRVSARSFPTFHFFLLNLSVVARPAASAGFGILVSKSCRRAQDHGKVA